MSVARTSGGSEERREHTQRMVITTILAVDLGASSGRVVAGTWDGRTIQLQELHRFANTPVTANGARFWDILRLWHEVQEGIRQATVRGYHPVSVGVDSWAVDFALLDRAGRLLGNPYHYRDQRTSGALEQVTAQLGQEMLFSHTGIQFLPFNTVYQLWAMSQAGDPLLDQAASLLMIPDLLHFWLSGTQAGEYTNASTTQLLNASTRQWDTELLAMLGLPGHILPRIVQPGTALGTVRPGLAQQLGLTEPVQVIAPDTHDTASAVAAIPNLDAHSVYISSGTWSLVGVERAEPVLTAQARELNLTNEGGVAESIRLLRNVGGLWLLQECQRIWQQGGQAIDWPTLLAEAATAPAFASIIDPDAPAFLSPDDMPGAIRSFCAAHGQPVPVSPGALARCCLESLALRYRWVIAALEDVTGQQLTTIRIVGGGSQNELLCQLAADICQRPVVAGPVEATALGNIVVQLLALGLLPDLATARQAVAASVATRRYEPRATPGLETVWQRFLQLSQL